MEKPCLPKDVLFFQFNFDNLANFLDYLENRYKETSFNQSELKARLENFEQLFDNMKNRIPDFKALTTEIDKKFQAVNEKFDKFEGFFEKINQVEKNISKLNDFELKSKEKLDVNSY
jgi:predicted patatin/cPLA2 family phospholipase